MKKHLTNNLALKLISVLIAIGIWVLVSGSTDPIMTRSFKNVAVTVQNGAYIEDTFGKIARLENESQTITVIVTGRKSVLDSLTDIQAVADLTQIEDMNLEADPVMVPVSVTVPGIEPENVTAVPQNIEVKIEERKTKDFQIAVTQEGKPDSNYAVGKITMEPNIASVSGPESIINKIGSIRAVVNVDGLSEDETRQVDLKVYDNNQEEFQETDLQYLYFNSGDSLKATAKITLWEKRSGVTLDVEYDGGAAEGFQVTEITTTPDELTVAGTDEALKTLQENGNVITIPAEAIQIERPRVDFEVSVDITKYLPEDIVWIYDDENKEVIVKGTVLPVDSKEIDLPVTQIQRQNTADGLYVTFTQDVISLRIRENGSDLEEFDVNQVTASIDLSGKQEGEYTVPVNVTLPEGYTLVDSVTANIRLNQKVDSASGTGNTTTSE